MLLIGEHGHGCDELHGSLPDDLTKLTKLNFLGTVYNRLSGPVPQLFFWQYNNDCCLTCNIPGQPPE